MHRGFIKVWRKTLDSGLIQMPNTLALFMYLLMNAVHADRKIGTPIGVVELKRGQFISGIHKLSMHLEQSVQQVRTGLERLHNLEIITSESTNRYTIYTIVNYGNYQDNNMPDNNLDSTQETNKQQAGNKLATTKEECKELKECKNEKNTSSARGSRLPPDWKLPLELGNWALQEKQGSTPDDIRKCAERFKDFWLGKAGKDGVKADWPATWRNWVRRDTEIGYRPSVKTNVKQQEAERILGRSTFKALEIKDVEPD